MRLSLCTVALVALATCSVTFADTYAPPPPAATLEARGTVADSLARSLQAQQTAFALTATGFDAAALTGKDDSRVVISSSEGSPLLRVDLPTSALETYAGSSICALTAKCAGYYSVSTDTSEQTNGLAAAIEAIAPEPPSVVLLATGLLLALSGLVYRRASGTARTP